MPPKRSKPKKLTKVTPVSRRSARQVDTADLNAQLSVGDQSLSHDAGIGTHESSHETVASNGNNNVVILDQEQAGTSQAHVSQAHMTVDNHDSVGEGSSTPSMQQFVDLQKTVCEMKQLVADLNNKSTDITRPVDNNHAIPFNANVQNTNSVSDNDNSSVPIEQAVSDHVQHLMGQGGVNSQVSLGMYDYARPIDLKVTDKQRNLIWSNQYIDLGSLLDNSDSQETLQVVSGEFGQTLRIAPQKATKKITSLGQWCDAFMIYITVYTRKFPQEIPLLTTYMRNIKLLHSKGGDFLFYDE